MNEKFPLTLGYSADRLPMRNPDPLNLPGTLASRYVQRYTPFTTSCLIHETDAFIILCKDVYEFVYMYLPAVTMVKI